MSDTQTPDLLEPLDLLELAQKKGQPVPASPNAQNISVNPTMPTPAQVQAQAQKVAKKQIAEGFALLAVHEYTAADGQPLYWKIRAKHPDGDKFIRAFHWTGSAFKASEPTHPDTGKPLYGLQHIAQADAAAVVWITEGEQKADALNALGLVATTTGGSSSANKSDWQPLAGRSVAIWPDHDEPGQKYAAAVASILQGLGCTVSVVRVADIEGLPSKGDAVDWLAMREAAGLTTSAADVEGLPLDLWQPEPAQPLPSFARIAAATASLPPHIEELMTLAADDVGILWEPEALEAIRALYDSSPAQWARLRVRLKAMKDLKLSDYEKAIIPAAEGREDEPSHAALLVALAAGHCQFVHDADLDGYALLTADGVRQCWRLDSRAYGEWLSYQFYQAEGSAPSETTLKSALASCAGRAKFEGEQREIFTRIAHHDGAYWLDLCNDTWQAIRITRDGWQVIDAPPVLFTRSATMRPLPSPERGTGNLDALWAAVNIPEPERLNILAWLLECLRPETPFVVLELSGEEGSAKSSTASALRDLIDPNKVNLRTMPKSKDDLFISAKNAHMVSIENLSHLSADYQDALCTLATGGGYASRTLYTNTEETCIELKKPIILNGIPSVVTAPDLGRRTLHIELPRIEQGRKSETETAEHWQAQHSAVFTGLLDLFVQALAELERVEQDQASLGELPPMADFALLGEAVYRVRGRPAGEFVEQYRTRRADSARRMLEASPVAMAMIGFLQANPRGYHGTIQGLLQTLEHHAEDHAPSAWPRSAKGLGDIIQRIKPALRQIGIDLHKDAKPSRDGFRCTLAYISRGRKNFPNDVHNVHNVHSTPENGQKTTESGAGCEHGELGEHGFKKNHAGNIYTPAANEAPTPPAEPSPPPEKTANGYPLNSGFVASTAPTEEQCELWEGDA